MLMTIDGCVTHDNKGEEVVEIASLLRVSYLCLCLLCHCVRDTNMETSSSQSHSCLKCNIKDRTVRYKEKCTKAIDKKFEYTCN